MEAVVTSIEGDTQRLLESGRQAQGTAPTDDTIAAVNTSIAASTALLNVSVAMLVHPGPSAAELEALAKIAEKATTRPRFETILAMCELLRGRTGHRDEAGREPTVH